MLIQNLERRHLSTSQLAMVAVKVLPMQEAMAKEREREAGRSSAPGRPAEKGVVDRRHLIEEEAEQESPHDRKSVAKAAARVGGVGAATVTRAKYIVENAPDLVPAIEAGTLKVNPAYAEAQSRKEAPPPGKTRDEVAKRHARIREMAEGALLAD